MFRKFIKQILKLFIGTALEDKRAKVKEKLLKENERTTSNMVKVRNNAYLGLIDTLNEEALDNIVDEVDKRIGKK